MNHPYEPPQLVKVLIGISAVMTILLTGVTLGLLSDTDSNTSISTSVPGESGDSQEPEEGITRPILNLDNANRPEANRGASKPCPQDSPAPGGQPDTGATSGECTPQPAQTVRQKLLVLLTLWKLRS